MFALALLALAFGLVIFLPILFVFVVLRVVLGLVGAVAKLTIGLVIGIVALVAAILAVVLVPLLPIVIVAGGTWILLRLLRRRPVPAEADGSVILKGSSAAVSCSSVSFVISRATSRTVFPDFAACFAIAADAS